MLQERLKIGTIEPYHDSYQNPWYLVQKLILGKYKFVNIAIELH